ncbi:TetR/AcrR family transcriptional regulator [Nocardioides jishulii]|nr:TetR/AcrR family transcriptional regulator [Nocardioides jishulii]
MGDEVKRSYRPGKRAEKAAATQAAILAAAREQFTSRGYAATTVADIAGAAGVNVDTLYATVGRKPVLLLAVIDMTLADEDHPVVAEQRDYVRATLAAPTARLKLTTYATALGRVMPRVAPLFDALAQAALSDPDCAALRDSIGQRRRANMVKLAADLRSTGQVRDDLTDDEVADLLWTTNAPEYYVLTVARGWSPATYGERLADLWTRLLLAESS